MNQGTVLLSNPLYNGQPIWNRARWGKHADTKKAKRILRDRSEWIITPAPHLKIVGDALWARVKAHQAEVHHQSAAILAGLRLSPTMRE